MSGDGGGGDDADEGGFDVRLPPNRFRTRSVAIVAGYSPERLYSNMPSGQQSQAGAGGGGASGRGGHFSVVESGMYKVGEADRGLAAVGSQQYRPEPIYWKQVRIFF